MRREALALPESTEAPHFDMTSFRVRGRIFATAPPAGDRIHLFVGEDEVKACVAAGPGVFDELWWGRRLSGVRVNLADADPGQIGELLHEAWRRKAPKRLVAAYDAARAAGR